MTAEELTAMVARRRVALAHRDVDALMADYAENCVLESPAYGTSFGRAAISRAFREFFASFPDVVLEIGDPLIAGDQVALPMTVHGTDTAGFLGQAPTGKQFRLFLVTL